MYPANHKTVFVLDHTPYFGISSETPLDFECLKQSRGPQNCVPLPPISKSLWTTSIETSMEYCRIVWDLFPSGKLVNMFLILNFSNIFSCKDLAANVIVSYHLFIHSSLYSMIIIILFLTHIN